jgi:cytochrome d ubiquinol oxidase subunit I
VDALDLARWQFGIITVYHFLFVPITIGLSAIVAGYETAWVRTGNTQWLRLTRFFGKLFLINLRDRGGHRHRPGVPVRHELERVLPVRR